MRKGKAGAMWEWHYCLPSLFFQALPAIVAVQREHLLSTCCMPSTILGAKLPGESAKVLALTERPF